MNNRNALHYVIIYVDHGTQGTVLWDTETDDARKAHRLANVLSSLCPQHGFFVRDEQAAHKTFHRDIRMEVDSDVLITLARQVC